MQVTIRPLEENDAETSWRWRNDADIWLHTGSRPTIVVTKEIEKNWIKEVIQRKNEVRFAICAGENGKYVGNVQLTNITSRSAELHIFIGEKTFQNQGIGTQATNLLLDYGTREFDLQEVYLFVNRKNLPAIASYKKCGFIETSVTSKELKMVRKTEENA